MPHLDNFTRFSSTDEVRTNLRQKSVHGALFTAAGGAVDFGLRLGSTLILARLLVPEQFGLIGMVMAVTGIAEAFSSLGLSTATIQAPEISQKQCSNLFWFNVAAGVLFAVAIGALAPVIAAFYSDDRLVAITLAISTSFVFGGLKVQHEALMYRQMRQAQGTIIRLTASFLSACLSVALALWGYEYWALVWREVLRVSLMTVGVWILCPWIPSLPTRGVMMHELLRFGRDMTLTQVVIALVCNLDGLLIGRFAGSSVLGLYRQAYNLVMAPIEQLNGLLFSVAQPGLSILQTDAERYSRYYQRILFLVSLTTVPLGIFTLIYAKEITFVMLGEKWTGTVIYLQIFAIAAALRPSIGTFSIVLISCGKPGRFLLVTLVFSVVLFMLMAVGIRWGGVGVAIAQVSATIVLMPWVLWYSFAGTPVTVAHFLAVTSKPLLAAAAMALVLLVQRFVGPIDSKLISVLAGCVTATIVYLGTLAAFPGVWSQIMSLGHEVLNAGNRKLPMNPLIPQ